MSRMKPEKTTKISEAFRLGDFVFSTEEKELKDASGNSIPLRKQSADVLEQLLLAPGAVVSKATLFENVWNGLSVTDDSLVQCISEIRRALNDGEHRLIQTSSKKGYRAMPDERRAEDFSILNKPSIAVLAFDDFSTGDDANYLSDAIAEGVIAELSRFHELFVIARNSSFSFRNHPTDVKEISQRLGVRYLLEGSQQKSGNRLRITVQLIDASAGHHLWSEAYERDLNDLFEVQDDIVRRVVATVAQKVIKFEGHAHRHMRSRKRTSLLHHLEARQHLIKFTPENNAKALKSNLAAIEADPTQPFGYVGLAFAHINGHRWGWSELSRHEALNQAQKAAQKAVELAPDYYDAYAAMAYVHLEENDVDRAISRARRALDLNPNDTAVMCDLAEFLGYAGHTDEAENLLARVMQLDPLHPDWIRWNLAWVQWLSGNCEQALHTMRQMSEIPPMANRVLAAIYVDLDRMQDAGKTVETLLEFDPNYSIADVHRNYYGKFKSEAQFERVLNNLRRAGLPE